MLKIILRILAIIIITIVGAVTGDSFITVASKPSILMDYPATAGLAAFLIVGLIILVSSMDLYNRFSVMGIVIVNILLLFWLVPLGLQLVADGDQKLSWLLALAVILPAFLLWVGEVKLAFFVAISPLLVATILFFISINRFH